MAIRSILVPCDGSDDCAAQVETAFSFATEHSAHVDGIHARYDPRDAVPLLGEGMSGAMIEELIAAATKDADGRAEKARNIFNAAAEAAGAIHVAGSGEGQSGLSATWFEEIGREDELIAAHGRLSDLIVITRPGEGSGAGRDFTITSALFETGRGVLILPPNYQPGPIGRKVAVAWNGTAPAARTVQSAMPIFTKADAVTVLTCASDRTDVSAADELANYLGWSSIKANVETFPPSEGVVSQAILNAASDADADLLVIGAYSHSRFMQTVLGGVTSEMLEMAELPLLMAH